jgi:hypothetical protein
MVLIIMFPPFDRLGYVLHPAPLSCTRAVDSSQRTYLSNCKREQTVCGCLYPIFTVSESHKKLAVRCGCQPDAGVIPPLSD